MSKKLRQLIANQPQVKVVQHAAEDNSNTTLIIALAFASAGVFYFFGYYFWGAMGAF